MDSISKTKTVYEDFKINIKFKLSALWATVMFCFIYGDYFQLYVPNHIDALTSKTTVLNEPYLLVVATCVMLLPIMMVLFSIVLKPKLNRLLNIIIGIIFTLMQLLIAITSSGSWNAFYILLAIIESIITSVIVWNAYKWPKIGA